MPNAVNAVNNNRTATVKTVLTLGPPFSLSQSTNYPDTDTSYYQNSFLSLDLQSYYNHLY